MKKFMTDIKTLAALLMAGAAFTACSSSDDNIIEQPQNPTEPQVYTMVIKASKGGDATTRALKPGTDSETGKNTVDAYWSGDETIEVHQSGVKIGEATAAPSANGNTTVTATLTSAPDPSNDLNFYLGGYNNVYTGQNGLLTGTNSISEKYDYAESLIYSNAYTVEGYDVIPGEFTTLSFTDGITKQAIIKFTLKDKANDAAISPSALTVTDGTSTVELTSIPASTYTANGDGVLYVAFPAAGSAKTVTLTATAGGKTYSYEKTGVSFTNGQYYEIGVKMSPIISLSGRTYFDEELEIADGYIVTGNAVSYSCKVAVADGATVTLRDVENDNGSLDPSSACPGIRCIGDATIILEGNNTVKGSGMYAGIYVPEGNTLTIRGTGSLTVTGGSGGAGIGGNNGGKCGSIVISGGTITATGGSNGAGIGLGNSPGCVFGDITISGGTVTATGSDNAPGIGGPYAYFENITITNDVTKVTVNKGSGSTYSIGTSKSDDMEYCGAISIGGTVYLNEGYFENGGDSYLQNSPLVYQP